MKRLAGVVARVTGNSMLQRVTFTDWLDLFREIANYRPEEKKVLVIDEFPYLVKTNAAFPSILQNAWDEILKDSNVKVLYGLFSKSGFTQRMLDQAEGRNDILLIQEDCIL